MDIAYRCYGKRHEEEALLAWKRKKKRIATTVKLIESGKDPAYNAKHLQFISKLEQKEDLLPYPDCYVPDCGAESLPHSGYCYKRILYHLILCVSVCVYIYVFCICRTLSLHKFIPSIILHENVLHVCARVHMYA